MFGGGKHSTGHYNSIIISLYYISTVYDLIAGSDKTHTTYINSVPPPDRKTLPTSLKEVFLSNYYYILYCVIIIFDYRRYDDIILLQYLIYRDDDSNGCCDEDIADDIILRSFVCACGEAA